MRATIFVLGVALLGGITFWLPSITLHGARGDDFASADVGALTVLQPVVAVGTAIVARRRLQRARWAAWWTPLAVGLGVWILGPLAMMVSATPSGGGFATPSGWATLLPLTAAFPLTTFMLATYDGSLGGLLLGTLGLGLLFLHGLRARGGAGAVGAPIGTRM